MEIKGKNISLVKKSLYEQIADYLEDMILTDDAIKEEQKLPSEQALADKFGVSRNVIRESLKILKERGLIDPRNGTGSYITKPEASNISDVMSRIIALDNLDYKDVYGIRIVLETAACKLAAVNATEENLKEMEGYLRRLEDRSISVEERRESDFAFHIAIAQAAGNPLLVLMVQATKNLVIQMMEKGIFTEGGIDDAIERHNSIFEALKAGNPKKAESMMYEHLIYSQKNVETYMQSHDSAK